MALRNSMVCCGCRCFLHGGGLGVRESRHGIKKQGKKVFMTINMRFKLLSGLNKEGNRLGGL